MNYIRYTFFTFRKVIRFAVCLLLYLVTFFLSINSTSAQNRTLNINNLTSENGLSDNQVTCVIKDKQGFLWVGTKDGLNRFDGHEFHIFRHEPGNSNSLCGNSITCLEIGSDSMLWIGTATSGFCSYDFHSGKFVTYNNSNSGLSHNNINKIVYDDARRILWVAFNNGGIKIFDPVKKSIANPEVEHPEKITSTYLDILVHNKQVYIAGIAKQIHKISSPQYLPEKVKGRVHTFNKMLVHDETIWAGAWDNGLHEFDLQAHYKAGYIFDKTTLSNFSGDEIISLIADNNGILWCGTKSSGIHFFDPVKRTFIESLLIEHPIKSRINCLYKDEASRIWIGTDIGLYVYDPYLNQFEVTNLPVPDGVNTCKINGRVFTNGGKEFIISSCGLFYKMTNEKYYHFKTFTYQQSTLQLTSIFKSSDNIVYIGSNKTVHILDTQNIKLEAFQMKKSQQNNLFFSLYSSRISSIGEFENQGKNMILAAAYGHCLYAINKKNNSVFYLNPAYVLKKPFGEHLVRKIFTDSKNRLWLCGALKGISRVNFSDDAAFHNFQYHDSIYTEKKFWIETWNTDQDISGINDVYDIVEASHNTFWITTQGTGLVKFSPENDTAPFKIIGKEFNTLQGIAKSPDGLLWILSSNGLIQYDPLKNQFALFDRSSGLPEGIGGYFFVTDNNLLTAGFNGGFIQFNPSKIKSDIEKPTIHISRIWIMDVPSDSLLFSEIKLGYDKNFIKFYVSSNTFTNNNQTKYYYMLEGVDNSWRSNLGNPLITYTNLPYGNFVLKVKAMNSGGLESDEFLFPFTIITPFYKTIYFILSIAFIITGAVYLLYQYRIRQIIKLQEVRNNIARDLHDDIGSTLGSIHLYSQIAHSRLKDNETGEIKSILAKIENSSSEIIDKTGDVVWAVKTANDTLKSLALRMEGYAASLLGTAGIPFQFEFDDSFSSIKLEMSERKNIFLIYKEALHNIVKYAQATEVLISLKKSAGKLKLVISDNGRGFEPNNGSYNGNGLSNMKYRAEEIKGHCKIESAPGKGTVVELLI